METVVKEVNLDLKNYFLEEPKPFTSKREVNWSKVQTWAILAVTTLIITLLLMPSSEPDQNTFYERAEKGSLEQIRQVENDPTQEAIRQLQESQVNVRRVHGSLDYLYRPNSSVSANGRTDGGRSPERNSSMILSREGMDTRTQLPAGTRVSIRLSNKVTIANQGMPVVGIVSNDVTAESGLAIPSGSKVLGDSSFDPDAERATISWRSIILPDGRERPFSAVGVGRDGQVGVNGRVQSDGVKNAVGQTLTRFVGAYAAGSMNTGAFGANQGGHENGLRNAVAQTATDRANALGEELKKERKWIELDQGIETYAVLNQPFTFRDVGAIYGR
jgi:type IV secretory pathway VirB10-like protein